MNWHVYIYILVFSYICGWCQTHHCRWPGVLSEANTQRTQSLVPWWVKLLIHNLRWKWHTIGMVVKQYFKVYLNSGSGKASTCCTSTLGVYWMGQVRHWPWTNPRRDNVQPHKLSRVFSTPNLWVFDEKVCTHVFTTLTHSVTYLVSWVVTLSVWPKSYTNGHHIV